MSDPHADRIRVLLADDQTLFVDSLRYVLEALASDIEIVDVCYSGSAAVDAVAAHAPEIVLLDVRMPEMDGVEAARIIHERHPEVKIVMLTTFADDAYVASAIRHGAVGYLLKNMPPERLVESIRAVLGGIAQIEPSVARTLLQGDAGALGEPADAALLSVEPLTSRERQVLELIMDSRDNHEIAEFLNVAEQTARNYVHNLYSKLGVSSRIQLMKLLRSLEKPDKETQAP